MQIQCQYLLKTCDYLKTVFDLPILSMWLNVNIHWKHITFFQFENFLALMFVFLVLFVNEDGHCQNKMTNHFKYFKWGKKTSELSFACYIFLSGGEVPILSFHYPCVYNFMFCYFAVLFLFLQTAVAKMKFLLVMILPCHARTILEVGHMKVKCCLIFYHVFLILCREV